MELLRCYNQKNDICTVFFFFLFSSTEPKLSVVEKEANMFRYFLPGLLLL